MNLRPSSRIRILAACALLLGHAPAALAAPWRDWAGLRNPVPACERIYRQIAGNQFDKGRTLGEYLDRLGPEFAAALKALGSGQHWVDLGAGEAFAAEQYLRSRGHEPFTQSLKRAQGNLLTPSQPDARELLGRHYEFKANVTAISYVTEREDLPTHFDKFQLLRGQLFEHIPAGRIDRFDLASDLYGVAAYTAHPDLYFEKALARMKDDGSLFVFTNFKDSVGTLDNTVFHTLDGKELRFSDWVRRLPGLEVTTLEDALRIRIRARAEIRIPRVMLERTDDRTPPRRVFREVP